MYQWPKQKKSSCNEIKKTNIVYGTIHNNLIQWFSHFTLTAICQIFAAKYPNGPLFELKLIFKNYVCFRYFYNFFMFHIIFWLINPDINTFTFIYAIMD